MRNKYNAVKTVIDGITFDSRAEGRYYEKLKADKAAGLILEYYLQPKFLLEEAFTKDGIRHRAEHYIADFKVLHLDGSVQIIDVKGVETAMFKSKRKRFEKRYPHLSLTIVKGGKVKDEKPKRPKTAEEKEKAKQRAARKKKSRERRNLRKWV